MALYAKDITVSGMPTTWPQFVWQVDPELCAAAHRFVDTFNTLFGRELPPPWQSTRMLSPPGLTNLRLSADACVWVRRLAVNEFWAPEIWTTERYRESRSVARLI